VTANPADLPVEQPTIRAGDQPEDGEGVRSRIPPSLLARAAEVIE
jgi:hypothetical protein